MSPAEEFRDQGYTAVRGFFSREEATALLRDVEARSVEADTADGLTHGGMVFNANIYRRSPQVQLFLTQQRLLDFLKPMAGGDLWVRWDQAVAKHPGAGVFHWHQDNGYNQLRTEHFQVWIALTETRNQNGGLWLAPGSHKRGLLPHRRVANNQVEVQADVGPSLCIDANIGDLILFSSLMLHRTGPNEADTTRVAYVAEYMPCADYDFDLAGPYFVAATRGASDPHFVAIQPGAISLKNQLLYWRPTTAKLIRNVKQPLRALRNALIR